MLQIHHLKKSYGAKEVLLDISFEVRPGEIVALLGKNGAGKSTTMNCVAGIINPTSGDITYEGQSLLPESTLRSEFGILITAVFFDYLNVEDTSPVCSARTGGATRPPLPSASTRSWRWSTCPPRSGSW